ncbi:zf-HC2 domain-containing protein [Desulfobotulus sp.]|uniref:anti-sigma factor family protein n=1 Tax=Desulfobotulus sp. TaxID=1940337 RepID=UPI002A36A430|nr:zf-HC2 domain-containing protein [Desulfobotulus sp.]MDY0162148.1 zf-HC2 domain-containing protein [Desulfobotulus sp.]
MPQTPPEIPSHCLALFDRFSAYVDGELQGEERRALEEHLQHCPKCRVCLATLTQSIRICNQVGSRPVPQSLSLKLENLAKSFQVTET